MGLGEAGLQCCVQLSECSPQTELATEERLDHFLELTPTPGTAFSVRNGGIGAGYDGTGHLFADGN